MRINHVSEAEFKSGVKCFGLFLVQEGPILFMIVYKAVIEDLIVLPIEVYLVFGYFLNAKLYQSFLICDFGVSIILEVEAVL